MQGCSYEAYLALGAFSRLLQPNCRWRLSMPQSHPQKMYKENIRADAWTGAKQQESTCIAKISHIAGARTMVSMAGYALSLAVVLLVHHVGISSQDTPRAIFKRPAADELVSFQPIKDQCEWAQYQGRNWTDTAACLRWLAEHPEEYTATSEQLGLQPVDTSQPLIVHAVWNGNLWHPKLQLMVKAFLASQVRPAPAQRAELWLWLQPSRFSDNMSVGDDLTVPHEHLPSMPELLHCPAAIKFKLWVSGRVLTKVPTSVWPANVSDHLAKLDKKTQAQQLEAVFGYRADRRVVAFSDFQRFALLAAYGGLYIDGDVQLLRDMRQLQIQPYWYRWEAHPYSNTAVMYARKDDPIMLAIVQKLFYKSVSVKDQKLALGHWPPAHPKDAYYSTQHMQQPLMMPCTIFNSMLATRLVDKSPDSQKLPSISTFHDKNVPEATLDKVDTIFGGAFTNHWHNHWNSNFSSHSWGAAFELAYTLYFNRQRPNIYGEMWDWNMCHVPSDLPSKLQAEGGETNLAAVARVLT